MTVGAAPTYKNVHKTSSEAVTGYTQAASALAYHVDHILSGPTGQLPLPPGVSNESPVEHPQPLALTGGPGVLPNAGSTSDLPMSLYAVSDIDTCYAHDPFTAPTVEWCLPSDEALESFFSALNLNEVDQFIAQVPIIQDQVNIDLIRTHIQQEYGCFHNGPNPLDFPTGDNWDYAMFPETVIETNNVSVHWLGECVDLFPPADTIQGLPVDQSFKCDVFDVELSMQVDANGNCIPMATAYMLARSVQGVPCSRLFKCLFDTGGTRSMAHRKVLPQGAALTPLPAATMCNTIAGNYKPSGTLVCADMKFPEFDANLTVDTQEFLVFDAPCAYDLILGNDFLIKIGLKVNYETLELEWLGRKLPMNSVFSKERMAACVDTFYYQEEEEAGLYDAFTTSIAESEYDGMNIDQVLQDNCEHLTAEQKEDLRTLFNKHYKLFDGKLRTYTDAKMDIELQPHAVPVYRRPYSVPRVHMELFRKELNRLVEIGVLERCGPSEWGLPTFIIPKKDGKVRWVSDMRELNKVIKPKDYTLPVIGDIMRKRQGYKFMTKLDLSMMFYAIELTDRAKDLCVISTVYGNYRYRRAPMGMRNSPAFAQSIIEDTLRDIDGLEVYIDDVGVWSNDWKSHVEVLSKIFAALETKGFAVNPLKCEFGVEESDFLGHWITPQGIKPWAKKVQAVMQMDRPKNASQIRTFVGMINWYRDYWPRRAHLLSPFTKLQNGLEGNKKAPIVWTDELEKCFQEVKAVLARDALLAFPNHNEPFDVFTDSSDYQMGAAILQNGRPVAYFSKKLSPSQLNYTTMEKELLAIVSTLNEYRSMLYGAKIRIYTDHRNLTYNNLTSQRVLRWRCLLESFNAEWNYLEGKLNVLADAFSRLPRFDYAGAERRKDDLSMDQVPLDIAAPTEVASAFCDPYLDLVDDSDLSACLSHFVEANDQFATFPSTVQNPLRYQWLQESQNECPQLLQRLVDDPTHFRMRSFGRNDVDLVCYYQDPQDLDKYKIVLTDAAADATIEYFHLMLNHPGASALLKVLDLYYHPQLATRVNSFSCDTCQRTKTGQRGYGFFPPRAVQGLTPWKQVDVDLIGPWYIQTTGRSGKAYEFYALTCIDRASGFPDGIPITRKTSDHVSKKFNECWLSRYPRPEVCAHDQGGEFIGPEFQRLLYDAGIASAPSTARNPQSNAIVERLHLTMGNSLRAQLLDKEPRTLTEAENIMTTSLANTLHAVRTNVSESTGIAPGALAFHRDMLHNLPVTFDLDAINRRRQIRVDKDIQRINSKRYSYDYQVGQQVMKKVFDYTKLDPRWSGPFEITQVHINGNITVQLNPHLRERLNIRRVKPYKAPTPSVLLEQDDLQEG
jgi:transposase InsO family protein